MNIIITYGSKTVQLDLPLTGSRLAQVYIEIKMTTIGMSVISKAPYTVAVITDVKSNARDNGVIPASVLTQKRIFNVSGIKLNFC